MKKALATVCVYDRATDGHPIILSLTVIDCKGGTHYLIRNNEEHPYKHENFAELYCDVISTCHSNGYYIPFIEEFGALCYKIEFITMERYSVEYATPTKFCITMRDLQHYMLKFM